MSKTKKIFSLLLTLGLLFTLNNGAYAAEVNKLKTSKKIQSEFDISKAEADYYAEIEEMVSQLEQEGIVIDLDDESIPEISDKEVVKDPKKFKSKIKNKDKAALKKGMNSFKHVIEGRKEIDAFVKENPDATNYTIKYPDGTEITSNFEYIPLYDEQTEKVVQNAQPWNKSVKEGAYPVPEYNKNYAMRYEWQFKTALGLGKVSVSGNGFVSTNNSTNKRDYSASLTGITGGESYAGVITTTNPANVSDITYAAPLNKSGVHEAQGWHQVGMQVSGTFSAEYLGLSVSVNGGGYWTQYAILKLTSDGIGSKWAATLQ